MQLGFAVPVSGSWATPANQVEVARRAEELGYASVWTFQRLLFPVAAEGKRWQPVYRSVADPIVTLAEWNRLGELNASLGMQGYEAGMGRS